MKKIIALMATVYASTAVAVTSPEVEIQYHLVHQGKVVAQGHVVVNDQPVPLQDTLAQPYIKNADVDGKGVTTLTPGIYTTGFVGQIQLLQDGRIAVYASNTEEAGKRTKDLAPPTLSVFQRLVRVDLKKNASTAIRVGELGKDYTVFLSRIN